MLAGDSDPLHQTLTPEVVGNPSRGFLFVDTNGALDYLPEPNFVGSVTFRYRVRASDGRVSPTVTDTIVVPLNTAPDLVVAKGGSVDATGTSATLKLTVSDTQTPLDKLELSAVSSNTALVSVLAFGGSGANRTMNVTPVPGVAGTAVVALTLTDSLTGSASTIPVTVKVGGAGKDTLTGTWAPTSCSAWVATTSSMAGLTSTCSAVVAVMTPSPVAPGPTCSAATAA